MLFWASFLPFPTGTHYLFRESTFLHSPHRRVVSPSYRSLSRTLHSHSSCNLFISDPLSARDSHRPISAASDALLLLSFILHGSYPYSITLYHCFTYIEFPPFCDAFVPQDPIRAIILLVFVTLTRVRLCPIANKCAVFNIDKYISAHAKHETRIIARHGRRRSRQPDAVLSRIKLMLVEHVPTRIASDRITKHLWLIDSKWDSRYMKNPIAWHVHYFLTISFLHYYFILYSLSLSLRESDLFARYRYEAFAFAFALAIALARATRLDEQLRLTSRVISESQLSGN